LDGHNSHTTYRFCSFAEKHKIIILCLPPHTTHRLQPCDVGVFGPLSSTWKSEVNAMSAQNIPIRKSNFLTSYSRARNKSFTESTILSAWRKTGISPLNRNAIPKDAFAPALNTTTKAAQPIEVTIPDLFAPIADTETHPSTSPSTTESTAELPPDSSEIASTAKSTPEPSPESPTITVADTTPTAPSVASHNSAFSGASYSFGDLALTDNEAFAKISAAQLYRIVNLPLRPNSGALKEVVLRENQTLREIIDRCCYQMQRDYAIKRLMEMENESLREQLHNKQKKQKKKQTDAYARHMTSEVHGDVGNGGLEGVNESCVWVSRVQSAEEEN
jgi:hypothetical protein